MDENDISKREPYTCLLDVEAVFHEQDDDPASFITEYKVRILGGEMLTDEVGQMRLTVVDLSASTLAGISAWEVMDCHSQELAEFTRIVRHGSFMPSIQRIAGAYICPTLVIEMIWVERELRSQGIGRAALDIAWRQIGLGCGLAALIAFPTEWGGVAESDPKAFRRDQKRVLRFYREAGFRATRFDGIMVKPLW